MHHLSSPEQTRAYIATVIRRIRRRDMRPLTLPMMMSVLAGDSRGDITSLMLMLNAIAQFTDLDDESEAITLQGPNERHSDETLARLVWQRLLAGACAQHPASS